MCTDQEDEGHCGFARDLHTGERARVHDKQLVREWLCLTHCGDIGDPWQAQLQRGQSTIVLL